MRRRLLLALLCAALIVAGCLGLFELYLSNRICFGLHVWGIPLGGMRVEEAAGVLREGLAELSQPVITLQGPDRSWGVHPASLGLHLLAEETAQAAFSIGHDTGNGLLTHLELLVGGHTLAPVLSYDEQVARLYLESLAEEIDVAPAEATLTLEGMTPSLSPSRSGRMLDVEASLVAFRSTLGNLTTAQVDLVVHDLLPQVVDASPALTLAEEILSEQFMLLLPNPREGDAGPWSLSPQSLGNMLTTYSLDGRLYATLNQEILRSILWGVGQSVALEPTNSRFHFDNATGRLEAITPSIDGRELDLEASLANIIAAVEAGQHTAPLVTRAVPPLYPETSTAEELGITDLVAIGDSYFIGSPSGRDHNIRVATSQFDGLIVAPGDTFSFNEYLGEVSEETGYDESYVTAGEQLAVEVGGGICQVSTTVFRAALWGGYPIAERYYHYQRVGYYELFGYGPGFDATVYTPLVDFKFVNDRPTPLLIEAEVESDEHRLVFRFYSSPDGRRVEIEGGEVTNETEPGPPIYELDEELEPDTVIEWQSAQDGLTATVERWVYDATETLLYHNVFVSQYAPRRASYHYGPGFVPPQD
jgi:vancomycin resistance protein YoaR